MLEQANIAVLVSGGGTNLQALIDAQNNGTLTHGRIKAVISSSERAYALTRAEQNGIASFVVSKKTCGSQERFEEKLVALLNEYKIDLIVLAGFMCILSEHFTKRFPNRIINVHPSLIPSFCGKGFYGLHVHEAALSYGVKVTGATVHYVNEVCDGGAIILQKAVDVQKGDTPQTLQRRVMEQAEWVLLPQAVQMVSEEICKQKGVF